MKNYLLSAALGLALFAGAAQAAPTADFSRGITVVHPDPVFLGAAESLGVEVAPLKGRSLRFPIIAGSLDLESAAGEILHSNGISLSAGETVVELRNFAIDTANEAGPILTGLVVVNESVVGRVPLFDLGLPELSLPLEPRYRIGFLSLRGVDLTLTDAAAGALNAIFGVSDFAEGLPIGEASVYAFGLRN